MRILLLNQFFWPDAAATSQLLTDLAERLAGQGHEVTVIADRSTYAANNTATPPPVTIIRAWATPFSRGTLARIGSSMSFLLSALWHGMRISRPDVILTLTTPPLVSVIGTMLKKLRGVRHYCWEMDVYPDIAVELGVLPQKAGVTRLIRMIADWSRRSSDGVIALGECMKDRLVAHGMSSGQVHVAHNWADSRQIAVKPLSEEEPLQVLYSGNLGLAHDVNTILSAMQILREDRHVRFVFSGGGPLRPAFEESCRKQAIRSVTFQPYRIREDLSEGLASGHIGLVTQKTEARGAVVPSKTYGLMAAGRPILFIGPADATPARIVRQHGCGWQVDCGDTERLVTLLRHLAADRELVRIAGMRARAAFLNHYDLPQGADRIITILTGTAATGVCRDKAGIASTHALRPASVALPGASPEA